MRVDDVASNNCQALPEGSVQVRVVVAQRGKVAYSEGQMQHAHHVV